MKKIKGILLFGILTLLGIGSSFSQFYDLRDNTGSQILIPSIGHYSSSPRTRFTFTLGNIDYYSSGYNSYSHGMADIYACYDSSYNVIGFKDQKSLFTFGDVSSCSLSGKISVSTGTANGINTFNYVYIRNGTPISPYSERKTAPIFRYMYFDYNNYHTSEGVVQDIPDGYRRSTLFLSMAGNYGFVSKSLTDGSFLFTSLFDDSFSISNPSVYSGFLLLHFGGYDTEYYNGNGTLLLSLGEESILFNYYTGFYKDYSDISQVSPSLNGYITYNNSVSDGYSQFIDMLSSGNSQYKNIILTNGSIPSNQLNFTYYYYNYYLNGSQAGLFTNVGTYTFNFEIDESVPTFIDVIQGGGNVEPIFDYNVAAIDYLITCYITSGDVCVFPSFDREDFESTFSVGGSVWNGYSGYLLGDNAYLFLKEYCINSNIIDYPFCSQLDLYSGAIIIINYENGSITYDIFSDSFMVSIGDLGSGQIGNVSCLGGGCSSINSGNPEYIHNFNSSSEFSYYSGEFLDSGYYDNFFNLNLTGYFLKCPWSYSSNRKVFGKKLLDNLGGYDILLPLNCFIAAYNHGKSFNFLDRLDLGEPIMGPATTKEHKLLYGFFDLIMSFGLLLFLRVVFKLFK